LAPAAAALSACQPRALEVTVSGTAGAIQIEAWAHEGFLEMMRSRVAIASLSVFEADASFAQISAHPLWRIEAASRAIQVHQIRYGLNPRGFNQVAPPRSLTENVRYGVGLEECGGYVRSGGADFQIVNGRVELLSNDN
jgi:hypothetical protein